MKRLLALGTLLVLGVMFAAFAHAAGPAQRWVYEPLYWRTTDGGAPQQGVTPAGFYDSTVVREAVTTAQTTYDTTRAIGLWGANIELPEYGRIYDTALDTVLVFSFALEPSKNTAFTAGADSFMVGLQLSMDGSNWVNATPTHTFDATRTSGSDKLATYTENNSLNFVQVFFNQTMPVTNSPLAVGDGATAPTWTSTFGWRLARFIIGTCGFTGEYTASLGHWTSKGLTTVQD